MNKRVKKRDTKSVIVGVTVCLITIGILGIYLGGWVKSVGKFLPNTYINDVAVGGMGLTDAILEVNGVQGAENIMIHEGNGNVVEVDLSAIDYSYDVVDAVKKLYNETNYAGWVGAYFKPTYNVIDVQPTYKPEKLERLIRTMSWGETETEDARIEKGTDGYYVVAEVYGDKLDSKAVADYVVKCFGEGKHDIDLSEGNLYKAPKVTAGDLESRLKELNEKYNYTITLDFTYTTEELKGSDVLNWVDEQGTVDKTKVEGFVAMLAEKYDTFKTTRHFQTTERGVVDIMQGRYSTGQYGWWMDQEKTVNKLMKCIEAGENVTIEPEYVVLEDSGYTYKGYASGRSANGDIGDTYIEVDLTNQHLWYYKGGELMFETDQIVSGKYNDESRRTPEGVYSVYTKREDYTMKTPEYSTKCKYFMRISFEGIGFHDLSRTVYGGDTYINNGSHGCINMKLDEVEQLYNMVERGTPVAMYY